MLWAAVGVGSGAVVLGALAPILFLLDNRVQGYPTSPDELSVAAVAAVIAGTWGAVGGLTAGLVCAAVTHVRERRDRLSVRTYGRIAAIVTAVLAVPIGALQLLEAGRMVLIWEVFVWVVAPVAVSVAVARLLGRWVWHRTRLPLPT